nr:hypothetical protein [uncultured Carboxylicivirga sp.]
MKLFVKNNDQEQRVQFPSMHDVSLKFDLIYYSDREQYFFINGQSFHVNDVYAKRDDTVIIIRMVIGWFVSMILALSMPNVFIGVAVAACGIFFGWLDGYTSEKNKVRRFNASDIDIKKIDQ